MKELSEMTLDELDALPEEPFCDALELPVVNGSATLPSGKVIGGGMLVGSFVTVPVARPARAMAFKANDPAFWSDEDGRIWRPVITDRGWAKQRAG